MTPLQFLDEAAKLLNKSKHFLKITIISDITTIHILKKGVTDKDIEQIELNKVNKQRDEDN